MQPQTADGRRADGFRPKYRHFHPMDRVWLKNPFDHDVVYQVADEYNRPFRYRLPAGKISELPGGAIATLGVKAVVDELIQNDPNDMLLMWDERVRAKHEALVIQSVKTTKPQIDSAHPGEINLGAQTEDVPEDENDIPTPPEEPFAGLNRPTPEPFQNETPRQDLPSESERGLQDVVAASLPANDFVASPNNEHPDAEG